MMDNIKYSCTSNTVKLFKHLDKLKCLQEGRVIPIMVHTMPTHRCQMACVHCCFKNRKDETLDMPIDMYIEGVKQFKQLGTRAIEITGGGDPTLYPHINKAMFDFHSIGIHMGVNTNGLDAQNIELENWGHCDWVRVSMNVFDYYDNIDIDYIKSSGTHISACYIWNETSSFEKLKRVFDFCSSEKIPCRIAPDCIKPVAEIDSSIDTIREMLNSIGESPYIFLSDFNIVTKRNNNFCWIHMIKPCFYTDGNIYACPSAELAYENDSQVQMKTYICRYNEVVGFYSSKEAVKPKYIDCSYCKYVKQQSILEEILMDTTDNEFA